MKYIFVTGGVVSSVGKGLVAASIGSLLEQYGKNISLLKCDPYLNSDPGMLSPAEHGEIYMLKDGSYVDLDFGHYERFTNADLTNKNSLTTGKLFKQLLLNEAAGCYSGKTIQYIPHVTDLIKERFKTVCQNGEDYLITEIGGTIGDIEGQIYYEAIRQFINDIGKENCCLVHVALVPFIEVSNEIKTKPVQQSVAKLREIGLQPDIIICRTNKSGSKFFDDSAKQKISSFCNIPKSHVIECSDVPNTIYECPIVLHAAGIIDIIAKVTNEQNWTISDNTKIWRDNVTKLIHAQDCCNIAIISPYNNSDVCKTIKEALIHSAAYNNCKVKMKIVTPSEFYNTYKEYNGAYCFSFKVDAAPDEYDKLIGVFAFCIEENIPLVTTGAITDALVDLFYVFGILNANNDSSIINGSPETLITNVNKNSKFFDYYKNNDKFERSLNKERKVYNTCLRKEICKFSSEDCFISANDYEIELIEYKNMIGCQFSPEFNSKLCNSHPVINEFIKKAINFSKKANFFNTPSRA